MNLVSLALFGLLGEVGFRLFWNPKYWIGCDRWMIGSGQTRAGRKWWPETTYHIESAEFRARFRTNELGYRARSGRPTTGRPYRIAFVGDSFTEAMQVESDQTFCTRIERGLTGLVPGRDVVCENFGVAATGPFDYWHRITHDVLRPNAPDALVLCLFPGNDFTDRCPEDGFEADGRPRREYFQEPSWVKHALTWLNLHSRFGYWVQRSVLVAALRLTPPPQRGPRLWWTDPAIAARAADDQAVRRVRSLLQAIAEDCRRSRTKLCLLVVGPVPTYSARNGQSPIGQIVADWKLDVPVIDTAIAAQATPQPDRLVFPRDRHLNEAGHEFVAERAIPALRAALSFSGRPGPIPGEGER